jgi:hypothetical protein
MRNTETFPFQISIMAKLEGKSLYITHFGILYPASRVTGRGPAGLGKSKLLVPTGQTQAHGWGVGHSEGHGRGRKARYPGAG